MARRGPRPTPKKILETRGSWRAAAGGSEPQFTPGAPDRPAHLSDEAAADWARIVPELELAGLITRVDGAALAAYCQAFGRWAKAETQLAKQELVLAGEKGSYQNPLLAVVNKQLEIMRRFLIEFGLSPAARARVKAAKAEEIDPFERLLNGKSNGQKKPAAKKPAKKTKK